MGKLNQPTPKENTLLFKITSFIFLLTIIINEHFALICELGFSEQTENLIKASGALIYVILTYYNFNQSTFDKKKET